jgi:hypothetical protein
MAYTGHENTGNRNSHGWAIAGAFVGQAALIAGVGTLLAGVGTGGTSAASISASPVIVAQGSAVSTAPDVQPLNEFPYQVAVDGQQGGGVFPDVSSLPSFTVKPGQDLTISLDLTVPSTQTISDLSAGLTGTAGSSSATEVQTPYNDSVQTQAPGTQVFRISWPGSASEMRPGTQWTVSLSTSTPDLSYVAPIASITVAS